MARLLISADDHLTNQKPRCRLDEDWIGFQESIQKEITEIANKKKAILIKMGDIFDTPNVPAYIVSMFLHYSTRVKEGTRIIIGNHDLPYHSIDSIKNSSIGIINTVIKIFGNTNKIKYIDDLGSWNNFNCEINNPNQELQFIHRLTFPNKKSMPPNTEACTASDLLLEFPNAKYIFTGDNHHSFHYEKNGRHVINPGCVNRQASDFIDYQPIVYFVDTEKEIIEEIPLSDTAPMVDDEYIKNANEKESRIESFVEKIKSSENFGLSFKDNVNEAISKNKKTLGKGVIDMIEELMEG
jgi:DNA repair exonuclease SbcCD nuclease subunit